MKAVIQAGGQGTRLRNVTKDQIPKPMVPISGKPLLQWQIERLKENEITDLYIIIGHLGENIRDYFEDGEKYGVHITYITETVPLGSAGALYYLKPFLDPEEDVLLLYGDVFFDVNIKGMLDFHVEKQSVLTAFAHPNTHPEDSDILEVNEEQKIVGFLSKKEKRDFWYANLVNAACYIIKGHIIFEMHHVEKVDFDEDILKKKTVQGENVYAYRSTEYIKDAGTEGRLRSIETDIASGHIFRRNLKNRQKCIFLDRDGTINKWNGLVDEEDKLELLEGVVEAVRMINSSEYLAIVITNQPVVARGLCSIEDVENIHKKLQTLLGRQGVYVDDIAFCPHHPDKGFPGENPIYKVKCNCRKPNIGLIEEMAAKYNISLEDSWMVGDSFRDIMTGKNAGMGTALVLTGENWEDERCDVKADMTCQDLKEAVTRILCGDALSVGIGKESHGL